MLGQHQPILPFALRRLFLELLHLPQEIAGLCHMLPVRIALEQGTEGRIRRLEMPATWLPG
jgi:hypothetical protein